MNELGTKHKGHFILVTYAILLYLALSHLSEVLTFLGGLISVITPFIMGILFAYILNILMNFLERRLFYRLDKSKKPFLRKLKRPLAIFATFFILIAFITGIILFVVPQLSSSVRTLTSNMESYITSAEKFINDTAASFNLTGEFWKGISVNWNEIITKSSQFISTAIPQIVSFAMSLTSSVINMVMGLIISVYLLAQKEKLISILKKLIYAFSSQNVSHKVIDTGVQTNKAFQSFISGQVTESLIMGVLVFIGMLIFGFPYAILCSTIIAVTGVIPIFGAWIGTLPSAFIILMAQPPKAIWFIVFIICLQQVESNLIYPKVVGDSIGLDGLWVLFALVVGGSLFGFVGMILGIPAFAVMYAIVKRVTYRKLREKNIVVE
ncbi:MAG: AI-2E family transporter [Clostridia bacterium]|nr:AI-2E family transporter [Clostridia bacterium]